jgi:transcriptional regulator with XRE-family HTH domain
MWRRNFTPGEVELTNDFSSMVRARRKELGLTQIEVAARIRVEEGRSINQAYLADIERGQHPNPRPHLIEEFARALELDRDVLYLAARQVPPEVADELRRLTPEERAAAWRVFKLAVMEDNAARERTSRATSEKGGAARPTTKKGGAE